MKNMIEEYIKMTPVKYQDTTSHYDNKIVEWQYLIGQALHVTKLTGREDRINIHYAISISDKDYEQFKEVVLSDNEFGNSLNELVILQGFSPKC